MNNKYLIYKITNTINNKVYIGQTSGTIKNRFKSHCNKDSNCIKLKNAINKYGREKFLIEQLDECLNKQEADNMEIYWINKFKSTNDKYGYNITKGGNTTYLTKKVMCLETKEVFDNCLSASKHFGCNSSNISNVCNGYKPMIKGKHFVYLREDGTPIMDKVRYVKPNCAKVICVELNKEFPSIKEAGKYFGVTSGAISNCLKGKSKKACGYHWDYVDKKLFKKIENTQPNRFHKTLCIETGQIFNTATEAGKSIGVTMSSIKQCCIGKSKTCGGYHWKYIKEVA